MTQMDKEKSAFHLCPSVSSLVKEMSDAAKKGLAENRTNTSSTHWTSQSPRRFVRGNPSTGVIQLGRELPNPLRVASTAQYLEKREKLLPHLG